MVPYEVSSASRQRGNAVEHGTGAVNAGEDVSAAAYPPAVGPTEDNVAMTLRQVLAFIRKHGIVLEAAQGPVPSVAEAIAGGPVRGSWWAHPSGHEIFAVTRAIRDSDEVLVCRLIKGKITFVHRRLWPALVRAAGRLRSDHLSQVREVHTKSGRHLTTEVPFPDWVPSRVRAAARDLSEESALAAVGAWKWTATAAARQAAAPVGRASRKRPLVSRDR